MAIEVKVATKLVENGLSKEKADKIEEVLNIPEVQKGLSQTILGAFKNGVLTGILFGVIGTALVAVAGYAFGG
jgi:hypothetical protein